MARALNLARPDFARDRAIELLFFRSRLECPDSEVGSDRTWLTAMLVNLSADVAHSDALSGVGFALSGLVLRKKTLTGEHLDGCIRDALLASHKGRTNFVLLLPKRDSAAMARATSFLDTLAAVKREFPLFVGLVIAVANTPSEWAPICAVDGFVRSRANNLCRDSSAVLALFAPFIAPTVLTCSDDTDVLRAVGASNAPSEVVLGTWDYGTRRLVFQDERDLQIVANAEAINLSPLWLNGTWSEGHELMQQLRPLASPETSCTYNLCTDFFLESLATQTSCPVVLLCKPAPPVMTA